MAYTKTNWLDRNVSTPTNYVATKGGGGALSSGDTLTMVASPSVVTEAGTPITALVMNNIEDGIINVNKILIDETLTIDTYDFEIDDIDPNGEYNEFNVDFRIDYEALTSRSIYLMLNGNGGIADSTVPAIEVRAYDGTYYFRISSYGGVNGTDIQRSTDPFSFDTIEKSAGNYSSYEGFLIDKVNDIYLFSTSNLGGSSDIFWSDDQGATWNVSTNGSLEGGELAFSGTYYYSTAGQRSTDGKTWTTGHQTGVKIIYDGTRFVMSNGSDILTSTDGTSWTTEQTLSDTITDLDYNGSLYVAVGSNQMVYTATDPTGTWTDRPPTLKNTSSPTFVITYDSNNDWVLHDGINWYTTSTPTIGSSWELISTTLSNTGYLRNWEGLIFTNYGFGATLEVIKFASAINSVRVSATDNVDFVGTSGNINLESNTSSLNINIIKNGDLYIITQKSVVFQKYTVLTNNIYPSLKKLRFLLSGSTGDENWLTGSRIIIRGVKYE